MQKLIWKNANDEQINLTTGNYGIVEWEGFSNTSLNIQSQQVPFQDGGVFLDALIEQKELSVTLSMQDGGNLENRYRMRRELIHILNPKLGEGYLIYTNDFISKRIKCIPQIPLFENHNSNDPGTPKASLSWTACQPYWEDLEETVEILNSEKMSKINNLGDIDSPVNITLSSFGDSNISIKNTTTDKEIKLNGSVSNFININTKIGEKKVLNENLNFKLNNISTTLYSSVIAGEYTYFCGYNGVILRTKDGNNFEPLKTNVTSILKKIIYAEDKNLLVAVGWNNTILTSSNGSDWTKIEGVTGTFEDVCYAKNKNLFIAITNSRTLYISNDGVSWTQITAAGSNKLCIVYNEIQEKFFIGGIGAIYESSDGTTWTTSYSSSGRYFSKMVTRDDEIYCFEIVYLKIYHYDSSWSQISETTFDANDINCFYYDNLENRFIVSLRVSESKPNVIYTSYDCKLFTEIYDDDIPLYDICLNFGYYFCCNENCLKKTLDFQTYYNIFENLNFLYTCVSSQKLNIVIFLSTGYNAYVLKNEQFEIITLPTNSKINSAIYIEDKGLFIAVGANGTVITSSDGHDWEIENANITEELLCIEYVDYLDQIIAVGANGTVITSSDGHDWEIKDIGSTSNLNSITYSSEKNLIVICGPNYCFTGRELDNLEVVSLSGTNYSVCYNDILNKFICAGNYIYYSNDGKVWFKVYPSTGSTSLQKIKYIKKFNVSIAVGNNGLILVSGDVINWNSIESQLSLVFFDLSFFNDEIFICGAYGNVNALNLNIESNIINKLDSKSDLNFFLQPGTNEIYLKSDNNKINGFLTFRNKYIGV